MIAVKVAQLSFSNMGFVVLLRASKDKRTLPIFIGAAEAQAIAIQINKVEIPRPLTHDLFKNVLDFLECRLKRVEVCDLVDGTYYARLILERDANEMPIDSRPSDAIALALRFAAPIFVDEKVMQEAGVVLEEQGKQDASAQTKSKKEHLSPVEALKEQLSQAIAEERYEDAAKLRDKITHLEQTHTHN